MNVSKEISREMLNTYWGLHKNIRNSKNYSKYKNLWFQIAYQGNSYASRMHERQRKRSHHKIMKQAIELYGESSEEDDEEDDEDENDKKMEILENNFNNLSKIDNEEDFEKYILYDPYHDDYNPNDGKIDIDIRFYWFFETILTEQPERQKDLKSKTLEELKEYEEWKSIEGSYSSDDEEDVQPKLRF